MVSRNRSRCLRSSWAHSMPAETLAARASARCRSSIVNGFCHGLRSRCSTPRRLRGVRSSTHSTEAIAPSAMLLAIASSGSSSTLWHRIDSPRLTQRLARLWLNWKRPPASLRPRRLARGSAAAGHQCLEFELVLRPLGQHDGAALGVEHGDGVVQYRMKKVFFLLDVAEVVAGPEQGHELVAGAGRAATVEGQALQGLVPGRLGRALDAHAVVGRLARRRSARLFLDGLDDDGHFAELQQVARPQRPLAVAEADAVEAGAVGAAQVAHAPAAVGGLDLGVVAADRAVVQHDLQRIEPADAQQVRRFPGLSLDGPIQSAQADRPFHAALPCLSGRRHRRRAPARRGPAVGCVLTIARTSRRGRKSREGWSVVRTERRFAEALRANSHLRSVANRRVTFLTA